MKLALMSDFHLGYNEDALLQAREALYRGLQEADVLLLAGDLFDHRVPKQEVLHDAIALFGELKAKARQQGKLTGVSMYGLDENGQRLEGSLVETPFVAIYGTHERRSKGLINAVQMLAAAGLVVNAHARAVGIEKNGEKVVIQGMGGLPEEFARQALKLLDPKPVAKAFNVFMMHQTLKELIPYNEQFLSMPDLPEGFDLYLNGHIHWNRELRSGNKHLLIPGSTVITQQKPNEQHGKGYYLYDTTSRQAEFRTINSRPFHYLELTFDAAHPADVARDVRAKLEQVASKEMRGKPLVKLKLMGTLAKGFNPASVDVTILEREFLPKAYVSIDKEFSAAELKQKVEILRRLRQEQVGAHEMGLAILKDKLQAAKSPLTSQAEELFETLASGSADQALKRLALPLKG